MFTVRNYEYDCTVCCRLLAHGNAITNALTKRSISDEKLAAFIAKTCCNYCNIVDDLGRSAVHLTASVGRYAILEWLLNQGAIINSCDYESGSTALHRALYYGSIDCAVLLIRYGASLELLDQDARCALQNVFCVGEFLDTYFIPASNELLVWGLNKNYNLGVSKDELLNTPQKVDFFHKDNISIVKVALGAYHSLFLDRKNQLYAVGHGNGGRLGVGTEISLASPKKVKVQLKTNYGDFIKDISVSRNHSLILTNYSLVFACGLNDEKQLGVREADSKLLSFKEVVTLRDHNLNIKSIIALDYSSLIYTESCIYVWGANHGQFNMNATVKTIPLPTLMKMPQVTRIHFVEANNSATVVYYTHGEENKILLFYNHKFRSIKPPNLEALKSISLIGGDAVRGAKGSAIALKLLLLTETNVLFFWYETTQMFYRCIFANLRLAQIDKLIYKLNEVFILSSGEVYQGKCHQIQIPSYYSKQETNAASVWSRCYVNRTEFSMEHIIRIDLHRLAHFDRVVDIFTDNDYTAFAVLQESSMKYFKLPTLTPEEYTFKKLSNEVSEMDLVHDVVFHVDDEIYPAHKFLIFARAPGLQRIIKDYEDKHIFLNYKHLTGKIFELIIKNIYTNYYPNEEDLELIVQSLGRDAVLYPSNLDICQLFLKYVEEFEITDLAKYLKHHVEQASFYLPLIPDKSAYRFTRLRRKDFPELYDVRIICENGVEFPAHKCILVARLEYFEIMFMHSWAEQTSINLSHVSAEYIEPILDFLYSADVERFRKQKYSEAFIQNIILLCDQFLFERLRTICEILLLDKIKVRKCAAMLEFACMYNCTVLKHGCMEFICQNLARVLQLKCLDDCDPSVLKCINAHYREMFKEVFNYRMITPDADAIEDELLLSFVDDFQVNLDDIIDAEQLQNSNKLKTTDNKTKHNAKQHEREAILTMMRDISLNESVSSTNQSNKSTVSEDLPNKALGWSKVTDKKEHKKQRTLSCNEILKSEEKPKPAYVALTKATDNVEKQEIPTTPLEISTPAKAFNFNLSDFTPTTTHEKLSQKQRKRLTSLRGTDTPTSSQERTTKPIAVPATPVQIPNAWGILPQSPPSATISAESAAKATASYSVTPPTGSATDPSSFANMMRTSKESPVADNSFSKILAEERKQREYYERMRGKSLVLTQMEETAIAELREFYNVDNVTDEIITIERKTLPTTMNFATWQRH